MQSIKELLIKESYNRCFLDLRIKSKHHILNHVGGSLLPCLINIIIIISL